MIYLDRRAVFFLVLSCYVGLSQAASSSLGIKDFASLPDVGRVQLSPDGQHLASLVRVATDEIKGTALNVVNLETGERIVPVYADNEKFVITWIGWANNTKMFVGAKFPEVRYGTPTVESRLLIADIKTGKFRNAVPKRYYQRFTHFPQFQDRVIDRLPEDDEHFLMQIDGYNPNEPDVFKVSLNKKKMATVQRSRSNIISWMTDRQHEVRIGIYFKDTKYKVMHRFPESDKWVPLWEYESFSEEEIDPIGFDADPNYLFVNALYEGRDAIFKVNLRDPELKKELVLADERYDMGGSLIYSHKAGKVVGLRVTQDGGYLFWDNEYKGLQAGINKGLPKTTNYITSFSADERKYIVVSTNDVDAGTYFIGDRDKKRLDVAAYRYRKLLPELMSPKREVSYKARDGLDIEAYLTLPLDYKDGDKLPTIIFPHGGPISFDNDDFDYWTQFFANRGYAVMQMNFRGSSGYGYDFMAAGLQNWGLAMQDDVEDGTHWMIEQGYADPDKICIVGASYGGYAALMGAVKSPELYRCAVSFAGVTDVAYLVKSHRNYTNYEVVKEMVGSNYRDLRQRSPLHNVEQIQTPVLLIHGSDDRSVKVEHSRRMHKALQKKDKQVEYLELEDGNHYLSNGDHRLSTFTKMDEFLKRYLLH